MCNQHPTPNTQHPGFTLIELLVVIALTAILFTLVFVPLIDSLNLTSRAGTQIEAQSAARDIMRQIEASVSGPVYIYDNFAQGGSNLGDPDGRIVIPMFSKAANNNAIGGNKYQAMIRFGMLEFVEPAGQAEHSPGGTIDPTTGKPDPAPTAPTNVALPLVPGRTIVRLFLGLRDNTSGVAGGSLAGYPVLNVGNVENYHGYANRFEDAQDVSPNVDNRVTLFRSEVQPYIVDPNTGKYVVNIALFHTLNSSGIESNDPTGTIILDDPNFFYDSTPIPAAYAQVGAPGVNINGRTQIPMWECWKAVSQTLLPLNKADAIEVRRDDSNHILYDTGNNPIIRPLITFTPQYVENDPGVPASLEAAASETPYTAATSFRSQYGAWCRPFRVYVYRSPDGIIDPLNYTDPTTKLPLFYEMDNPNFGDPNYGIGYQGPPGTNVGPIIDPVSGVWSKANTPQFAFTVDYDKGTVNFAFPHTVYDRDANGFPLPMYYNPATINNEIDVLLNNEPQYAKRFLWLRVFDTSNSLNPTGAISPLDKFYVAPPAQYNVRIVPGSERVFGPDQNPGRHYGYRTQYTRVSASAGAVGKNQYRILYENAAGAENAADANDPRVQTGYVEFDSQPDKDFDAPPNVGSSNLDPSLENPSQAANVTAVYRPHSMPLLKYSPSATGADGNGNAPADPIEVSYSFQMNRPTDVVKIDYLTRSIINVNMEMRLYDPRSARPQTSTLAGKVSARNLQR